MGPNNIIDSPFRSFIAAIAITKGQLCKPTAAAETVTPCTARVDAGIYVAQEDVDAGTRGTFRAFTGETQHRVKISAGVTRGAKLMIDASNVGQLITATTGVGVGVAEETGGAGATILVQPCFTET